LYLRARRTCRRRPHLVQGACRVNARIPALILPGYANSGPGHWQSHWQR
jgi:hypothetical protein